MKTAKNYKYKHFSTTDGTYMMTKTIKLSNLTKSRLDNIKNDKTYDEVISYLITFMENTKGNIFEEPIIVNK